jgi:hypothetical protein
MTRPVSRERPVGVPEQEHPPVLVEHDTKNADDEGRAHKSREEPLEGRWKMAGEHVSSTLHTVAAAFPSATLS